MSYTSTFQNPFDFFQYLRLCIIERIRNTNKYGFLLFFISCQTYFINGQSISFDNTVAPEITVCEATKNFTIAFTNETTETLTNITLNLQLPSGIQYEMGSLANVIGGTVQELSINNLEQVSFTISNLTGNGTISFDLKLSAHFDAYQFHISGGIFRNKVTVNYSSGSQSTETEPYNILYPALTITKVEPLSITAFVGQTFTRKVTIVNGGYGQLANFVLKDSYDNNLQLTGTDKGILNAAGTEITFNSNDFTSIGDGDGYFEQNESIIITQTIIASGCNSVQSKLQTFWGCDGKTAGSNKKYPYTTIQLFAPNMVVTSTPAFNICVDGTSDGQMLRLKNNGSGPANQMTVEILQAPNYVYSAINPNTISYRIDKGATISIAPTKTTANAGYNCLSSSYVGAFQVALPPIQPNEIVELFWESYTCDTDNCGAVSLIGWEYEVKYTDMCLKNNYKKAKVGQEEKKKNLTVFYESPSDLVDQQVGEYMFMLSSATFDLPEGTNPYFEVNFEVPSGLIWSGNATDLAYISGDTEWMPSQVDFNPTTRKLTAKYPFPIPFPLARSEFRLKLRADCSVPNANGLVTVGMQLFYIMDSSCPDPYRMPLTCYETPMTYLHCPGVCLEGLAFKNFGIERTNFGQADNNRDGLPDASNTLDFSKIKTNRVMMSDTFKTVFNGVIKTSASYPSWEHGYASSILPYGDKLKALSANVTIMDKSTGNILTAANVPFTTQLSNGKLLVKADFSPSTLAQLGNTNFVDFLLESRDEVEVEVFYSLVENIGGTIEQILVTNDFYVTPTANGTPFQCNDWNGNVTFLGYYFTTAKTEKYAVKSCSKTIEQSFYLSIGNCCSNYAGGDFFPYEYRNWAIVKDVKVEIPSGYTVNKANLDYYRTKFVNSTVKEQIGNMLPTEVSGQTYTYDLATYFTNQGGTLNPSDDGFQGTLFLEVTPACNTVTRVNAPVKWTYRFTEANQLGGQITANYTGNKDQLRYLRGDLQISTNLPTVEGLAPTVSWDITIKNTTSTPTTNSWLYVVSFDGVLNIVSVEDANGTTINPVNGFFQLGDFGNKASKKYKITATSDNCVSANLMAYTGYSCEGYPTNFNSIDCPFNEFPLKTIPETSELQVRVREVYDPSMPCDPVFGVELEMLSSKLAAVKDMLVNIVIPTSQSILIVDGSTEALYPNMGSFQTINDPTLTGNTYSLNGATIDPIIGTYGLVGITDVTANIVKVRFKFKLQPNFDSSDLLRFDIASKRSCGDPLPTLSLAYDPNAVFAEPTNIGLNSSGDNWAASWGDYNGDGHVDLFITTHDLDSPNNLYRNNGNGTFTKVTTGPIATDKASSLAASWADYDNDRDLDLIVANNIGTANFLYRNEGGGNFIKIQNDPIVNDYGYAHGVSWADYNKDGHLDLFVASFFATQFNSLYLNNGDGTFTKATGNAVTMEASSSTCGVWGDYDNDGLVDLFVANTYGENNSLYQNKGNGNFLKINIGAIVNDGGHSVGASWADYDNDSDLDLFVANAANENNFLYRNEGNGAFTKITTGIIVNNGGHSHGSGWADYDNDGWLDLFVANDQNQNNGLYKNNKNGSFTKVENAISQSGGMSFGAAWADYDNDGGVDLFVANRAGNENFLYQNVKGTCQGKSCIILVGTNSNQSAIGARIYLTAMINGQTITQMREITSQSGGGIGGQSELKSIFGVGDAGIIDQILVKWPSGYEQVLTNQLVDDCLVITEENASKVCGTIFHDENENCMQDADEKGIANQKVLLTPGNHVVFTDENGQYEAFVPVNEYDVVPEAGTNWALSCPTTQSAQKVNVVEIGTEYCGFDIGFRATCVAPDLNVEAAVTAHRVGFENLVSLTYKNGGTIAANEVVLSLILDPYCIPIESTIPWTRQDGQTLYWDFASIPAGTKQTIYLTDSVAANTPIGQELVLEAGIESIEEDCNMIDNAFRGAELAIGALDPNDILVSPEGAIQVDQVLTYKIRFQNVGNLPVANVRIESELPKELDQYTFELGIGSHSFRFEQKGNTLQWEFPNIMLADSVHNEPESHGYVTFRILPKADLPMGTFIEAGANIFFDNMAPVATNVVRNRIQPAISREQFAGNLLVYPNPTKGTIHVDLIPAETGQLDWIRTLTLYNIHGVPVQTRQKIESEQLNVDLTGLATGLYYIKAVDQKGAVFCGKVFLVE